MTQTNISYINTEREEMIKVRKIGLKIKKLVKQEQEPRTIMDCFKDPLALKYPDSKTG